MTTKICVKCKEEKDIDLFYRASDKNNERHIYCKACKKQYDAERKERYADTTMNSYYLRTYGISLNEYNDMLVKQNYVCLICSNQETTKHGDKVIKLSVDHNHITGKVRGLLCKKCNAAIAMYNEDEDIIQRAIDYLLRD